MSRDFSTLIICFAQKVECIMNSYFRQNVKLGLSSARAKHQWVYRRVGAERGEQHRILASGCQSGQNKRHRWALKPLVPLVTPSPFVPLINGHWTGFCTSQRLKKKLNLFSTDLKNMTSYYVPIQPTWWFSVTLKEQLVHKIVSAIFSPHWAIWVSSFRDKAFSSIQLRYLGDISMESSISLALGNPPNLIFVVLVWQCLPIVHPLHFFFICNRRSLSYSSVQQTRGGVMNTFVFLLFGVSDTADIFAQVNIFTKSKPHSKKLKNMMERIRIGYDHAKGTDQKSRDTFPSNRYYFLTYFHTACLQLLCSIFLTVVFNGPRGHQYNGPRKEILTPWRSSVEWVYLCTRARHYALYRFTLISNKFCFSQILWQGGGARRAVIFLIGPRADK